MQALPLEQDVGVEGNDVDAGELVEDDQEDSCPGGISILLIAENFSIAR